MRDLRIPTVVWLTPVLPFINDTEDNISGILNMCVEAKVYGVICFGMGLTLREGNREYFYEQLERLFPGLKEKYIPTYGFEEKKGWKNNGKSRKKRDFGGELWYKFPGNQKKDDRPH